MVKSDKWSCILLLMPPTVTPVGTWTMHYDLCLHTYLHMYMCTHTPVITEEAITYGGIEVRMERTCFPCLLAVSKYSPCLVLWNTRSPNLARRCFHVHRRSLVPSNMSVKIAGSPTDAMCWIKLSEEGVFLLGTSLSRGRSELNADTVRNPALAALGSISWSRLLASLPKSTGSFHGERVTREKGFASSSSVTKRSPPRRARMQKIMKIQQIRAALVCFGRNRSRAIFWLALVHALCWGSISDCLNVNSVSNTSHTPWVETRDGYWRRSARLFRV